MGEAAIKLSEKGAEVSVGENQAEFWNRHIGPQPAEISEMLKLLGYSSLQDCAAAALPKSIALKAPLNLGEFNEPLNEVQALRKLRELARTNKVYRSYIGAGYYNTLLPAVIQRNILENPCWYTQYTPYQPEISQGRLEALLNFQTLITELSGLPVANASLLDEGTAAAEAMNMCWSQKSKTEVNDTFIVADNCHPQTISVVKTRASALGITVKVCPESEISAAGKAFGVLLQYPGSDGNLSDYSPLISAVKETGAYTILAADLLALTLIKSPGELGADIALGNTQRFGVPLGLGGPHAAYLACKDEFKRIIPGRIIGVSRDAEGNPAMRLALQTREQHIRREKATSNICTAQALLAIMASMYAVYHGPAGLKKIAARVHGMTAELARLCKTAGLKVKHAAFFDTLEIELDTANAAFQKRLSEKEINLWLFDSKTVRVSLDETVEAKDLVDLVYVLTGKAPELKAIKFGEQLSIPAGNLRKDKFLQQSVFNQFHSETEFLRYVRRLEVKDLSLATAMIPLGSCTMKLNATSEMLPVSWPEFAGLHPFAPVEQWPGYARMFKDLEELLQSITGLDAVSLQPNAGSQGEYAGLLVIRAYHLERGDKNRNICIIPRSAHGTNPASAVMAGMQVVVVECDDKGNIDISDLTAKADLHAANLAALMVTYPSTHGVFEEGITDICEIIHARGGQVYMDGANLNALVGLSSPERIGADVVHINLHKTFCIPHGGGGPGMGPIAVKKHLADFLPNNPLIKCGGSKSVGAVSAAPYGSAAILPISWMYITMMGSQGVTRSTEVAILNANYIATRLSKHYPVLFTGNNGLVAHECILDLRPVKASAGIEAEDVAKRLMDYGFHAPTMSWPVAGTLMIEPTESESKAELDRFCDAMIAIREEIAEIEKGTWPRDINPLKCAPHTANCLAQADWDRPYTREQAVFPTRFVRQSKFWPAVARVDSAFGDRNFVCTCPDISSYS